MGKRAVEKGSVPSRYKKKKKRRSRSSSNSSSSSSCSSLSSIDEETKRKLKKKLKKLKKKKKLKKEKKALKKSGTTKLKGDISSNANIEAPTSAASCHINNDLIDKSRSLAPMTKEEWEKQQNTLKRVFDEETGRMRLVRGTGEIVEECVSRDRHLAINKQATKGDGEFFQRKLLQQIK